MSWELSSGQGDDSADLAIANAIVATVDSQDRVLSPGNVAITGNRISALAGAGEAPPRACRMLDGKGMLLLPGFVNVHLHLVLTALRGRTEDAGSGSFFRHMGPLKGLLNADHALSVARVGALEALRFGSTTVVDTYLFEESVGQALRETGLRGVLGESIADAVPPRSPDRLFQFDSGAGERKLKDAESLIARWHGRDGGRFRCVVAPHAPESCSPELLREAQALARRHELPLSMHVAHTQEVEERMRSYHGKGSVEFLADAGLLGPGLIAAHCIYLSPTEIPLLADSKTWVAHIPMMNAKRGHMAPVSALRPLGANIALGSDNMTQDMVMATRMATIVSRLSLHDGTSLPPHEALRLATIEGARALGLGEELGSIEVGKFADLVMVDLRKPHLCPLLDPVANFLHWGLASDVHTVIVDGEVVLEEGHAKRVDEQRVMLDAQRTSELLWERLAE